MSTSRAVLIATLSLLAASAWSQSARREPYIGYAYPAGGQQGTNFQITLGGQNLRGSATALFTGEGVRGEVVEYIRPLSNKQVADAGKHLRVQVRKRLAEAAEKAGRTPPAARAEDVELEPLADHPWLRDLEKMSLQELNALRQALFDPKRQPNAQIAEWVLVNVTIEAGAAPGDRELRLVAGQGLTNPVLFEVGLLPEVAQHEPTARLDSADTLDVPVLINGQIMPGDTDFHRFRARKGQRLVITTRARSLVPYLADAVPGWFQAVVTLHDEQGREVAFADDYRFDPDPVLLYETPEDGEYLLEIRDSIYRGREDFVYRISVSEQPFITWMFPLGGRVGGDTKTIIGGWNLPAELVRLDTRPGADHIRHARWRWDAGISNPMAYAVDDLHDCSEVEPNDTAARAQQIAPAIVVNGRISRPGDVDSFRFEAAAGEQIVAEVYARRLGSPLDALLRLTDATGRLLAWNDDHEDRSMGLMTHHADSYLSFGIEQAGSYALHLSDVQGHGGDEYGYRLRIGPGRPDFALRMTPASLSVIAGRSAAFTVHALRRDGFDGEIEVVLSDPPPGFSLTGMLIPAGQDAVRMTLSAPRQPAEQPVTLQLEGRARIGDAVVSRPVVPAQEMMQAFAYYHLVPAQTLMVMSLGPRRGAPVLKAVNDGPVRIPAGGTVQVRLRTVSGQGLDRVRLELSQPPGGVTMREVTEIEGGLALLLHADANTAKVGHAGNLIVEAAFETENTAPDGRVRKWRAWLGILPAIPFVIVE